eukprot:953786-Heterocapsa_arctica.AAC.1
MELLGDKVEKDGGIIPPVEERDDPPKYDDKEGPEIEDEDEKKQGLEVRYMGDPVAEYGVQQMGDMEKHTYLHTR